MARKYQPYLEYQNTGVEWLEDIPKHWDLKKLKFFASVQPSNVDKKTKEGERPVNLCNYTDVYYNDQVDESLEYMAATATDEQIGKFTLKAGDIIITKDSEDPTDIAIPTYVPNDLPGVVCGYHLAMIRPFDSTYGSFIKRVFESGYARAYFCTRSNGLTRYGLGAYPLSNVFCPNPPKKEAQQIANFLDYETAKIDTLIDKQQQLIKLLKEKHQAVISHAVTKGLNPDAPMKDSCVEWLGEVPEHWGIVPLKYLVSESDGIQMGPFGGMLTDLGETDTGYKVFGQENTISGDFTKGSRWISKDRFEELSNYHLKVGDIVLTRKGSLGNARLITDLEVKGIIDSDTIRIRINSRKLQPKLMSFLMHNALYVSEQIARNRRGAILPGINTETISNILLLVPQPSDQRALFEYLQLQNNKFDSAVEKCISAIELLEERRIALISAAVTGKIDVRTWQPAQTDIPMEASA